MNFKNQRIIVEIQGLVYGIQTLFFEIKSEEQFLNFKDYFVNMKFEKYYYFKSLNLKDQIFEFQ